MKVYKTDHREKERQLLVEVRQLTEADGEAAHAFHFANPDLNGMWYNAVRANMNATHDKCDVCDGPAKYLRLIHGVHQLGAACSVKHAKASEDDILCLAEQQREAEQEVHQAAMEAGGG